MVSDSQLESELKEMLVTTLRLLDVAPEAIDSSAPLFGGGLGLDSIDALEIGMALRKRFGVSLNGNEPATREALTSIRSLAQFIRTHESASL